MADLLPVNVAVAQMLAEFTPLPPVRLPLQAGLGRVLAAEFRAPHRLPPFASSAMDGYALLSADVQTATANQPIRLTVTDDIPAGIVPQTHLLPGTAQRIMTGAPLPPGADAVIPVEDTDDSLSRHGGPLPNAVQIYRAAKLGVNIRPAGEDAQAGDLLLAAGDLLLPHTLGLLASLGQAEVNVHRQPRVAILSTGDELLPIEAELEPGKIRNSNSVVIAAQIEQAGGQVINLGIAKDDESEVEARLQQAIDAGADLLVTTAGVSMGARDVVRLVIERHGQLQFWRVNMRPGKPVVFGRYKQLPLVGLPGNPVSAFVTCEVFVRPILRQLAGHKLAIRPFTTAEIVEDIASDGRESYLRATLWRTANGQLMAKLAGGQGSNLLRPLAVANGLIVIPAGTTAIKTGAPVSAWLFENDYLPQTLQ